MGYDKHAQMEDMREEFKESSESEGDGVCDQVDGCQPGEQDESDDGCQPGEQDESDGGQIQAKSSESGTKALLDESFPTCSETTQV